MVVIFRVTARVKKTLFLFLKISMSHPLTQDPTGGPQHGQNPLECLTVGGLLPLPELNAQDLARATSESCVAWLWGIMGKYRPGDAHCDFGDLVTLQKVSLDTIRCARVYAYEGALWWLSMLRATCGVAGITLDLHLTLVTPLQPGEVEAINAGFVREETYSPEPKQVTAGAKEVAFHATADEDDDDGYNVGMEVV